MNRDGELSTSPLLRVPRRKYAGFSELNTTLITYEHNLYKTLLYSRSKSGLPMLYPKYSIRLKYRLPTLTQCHFNHSYIENLGTYAACSISLSLGRGWCPLHSPPFLQRTEQVPRPDTSLVQKAWRALPTPTYGRHYRFPHSIRPERTAEKQARSLSEAPPAWAAVPE